MGNDAQGVYQYDGTELGAPGHIFQNLGMGSVSTQLAAVRSQIAGLQLLTDSDWINVTSLASGWTQTAGYQLRVRKVGARVDIQGALTIGAGFTDTICTVPSGFRPAAGCFIGATRSSTAAGAPAVLSIQPTGVLSASSNYRGTFAAAQVLPITGFWYVT